MNKLLAIVLLVSSSAFAATSGPMYSCSPREFTMTVGGKVVAQDRFNRGPDNLTVNERSIYFKENAGKNPEYIRLNYIQPGKPGTELFGNPGKQALILIPESAHTNSNQPFVMIYRNGDDASNIVSTYTCRTE